MAKGWCFLKEKMCNYGGNKTFNYGFFQGTSGYCYKLKLWLEKVKECPLEGKGQGEIDG